MKNIPFYIYAFTVWYCVMIGTEAWFTWNYRNTELTLLLTLGIGLFQITNTQAFNSKTSSSIKIAFLLLLVAFYSLSNGTLGIQLILKTYLVWSICCLKHSYKYKLFKIIQRSTTILLIPSLIIHYVLLFIHLPPIGGIIEHPSSINYVFENYIFLLTNSLMYEDRFCGFTLEPGYIGSFCAFMLYADKFRLKKIENITFLLAIITSLSLAGYILTIMGLFMCRISNIKLLLKRLIQTVILIFCIFYISQWYNNGDNLINEKIVERLKVDNEKGIKGNNRVSDEVDDYYNQFLRSDNLLFGYSPKQMKKLRNSVTTWSSTGYKTFLMDYGLLRMILVLLFYYIIAKTSNDKYYSMGFFFIITIYFLAAGYIYSLMWLIIYVIGIQLNTNTLINRKQNN